MQAMVAMRCWPQGFISGRVAMPGIVEQVEHCIHFTSSMWQWQLVGGSGCLVLRVWMQWQGLRMNSGVKRVSLHFSSSFCRHRAPFPCETTFRQAYYGFMHSLQATWTFKCPICKDEPPLLCCDATMLTLNQANYCGTPITQPSDDHGIMQAPGHRRAERSFSGSASRVKLLEQLSVVVRGKRPGENIWRSPRNGAPITGWDPAAFPLQEEMSRWSSSWQPAKVTKMASTHPSLVSPLEDMRTGVAAALTAIAHLSQGPLSQAYESRAKLARLVSCLASTSPVISYVPPAVARILANALAVNAPFPSHHDMWVIQQEAPILFDAMAVLNKHAHQLAHGAYAFSFHSVTWHELFKRLCMLSHLCQHDFSDSPSNGGSSLKGLPDFDESLEEEPSCMTDRCLQSGICSGLKRGRPRIRCAQDASSQREASCRDDNCNHGFHSAGKRTGGIFTWFCQHGVCYAAYIIPTAEGRDEAYSFLTGYLKKAPKVVVYDFACNLHEFCMNRAPEFFKDTLFVIDKFHWRNHTSCALSYNMVLYARLVHQNSQLAEQCNSALKKVKPALSHMLQKNFMASLRLFLHAWNVEKCVRLQPFLGS